MGTRFLGPSDASEPKPVRTPCSGHCPWRAGPGGLAAGSVRARELLGPPPTRGRRAPAPAAWATAACSPRSAGLPGPAQSSARLKGPMPQNGCQARAAGKYSHGETTASLFGVSCKRCQTSVTSLLPQLGFGSKSDSSDLVIWLNNYLII